MVQIIFSGLMIPFAGTALGAALVLFMKKELGGSTTKILSGFAAGVMVAASIWSLLIPSIEQIELYTSCCGLWSGYDVSVIS